MSKRTKFVSQPVSSRI